MAVVGKCIPLRRTTWALLLGRGFGALVVVSGVVLLWASVVERDGAYVVGAFGCGLLWAATSSSSLRLCSCSLETRKLLGPNEKLELADIVGVEVGKVREGHGYSGYTGFAMVIEATSGERTTIEQSRYCGRRRLTSWAQMISDHDGFSGRVHVTPGAIKGGRP